MFTSLNPGTVRLSIPFDEALRLARENGFAALDLPLGELLTLAEQTSVDEVKGRFAAAGLRPGGWGLPVDFRRDDETYRAGLQALPCQAGLAQALGSPWCSTWILPFSDELDFAANMERHVERLRPAAQILADHGCRLGLEFVGPKTLRDGHAHEFIHTIEGALDLGRRIGTGNVGLLLDCFHWYTAHGTADDLARLSADQIVYVHVNDAVPGRGPDEQIDGERLLPGASGVIDITAFLQALGRMGYDGPVVVEPFNAEVNALPPAERVRAVAQSLTSVLERAGITAA
ncbi:MAG TPA: sugar phosphate isomerase/epimerase [Chloroflexota bacterium]|nr:sugar phosphate isomerase/epimerase [Chloroflexota bacterium]